MDIFSKEYNTYRSVLSLIGLWPYHKSSYVMVKRIIFITLTFIGLSVEILSLGTPPVNLQSSLLTLSTSCPIALFLARYVSFIYNFPVIRFFFDHIRRDGKALQSTDEMMLLMKYINRSGRVISTCLWMSSAGIVGFTLILLTPILLDVAVPLNETRTRYIHYITKVFTTETLYMDIIAINIAVVATLGLLTVTCTETTLTVISYYTCALFKIASYRISQAIKAASNSALNSTPIADESNLTSFYSAVDIHTKAIECVDIAVTAMMIPYLIASLLVVVSFAVNLHRLFQAMSSMNDFKEIIVCILLVTIHMMFMFFNNYSGQMVIEDSLNVFEETYNSTWYYTPLKVQKFLLFTMMRSCIQCSFNLSGLFTPCYNGFSVMMSTSFSYFTVMYSLQQN